MNFLRMYLSTFILNMILQKLKKKFLRKAGNISRSFAYHFLRKIPTQVSSAEGLKVLVFHGVCKEQAFKFNSRFVSEKQFEEQLIILKKCYNLVSLEDVINKNLVKNKLNILLTFDDGLKNNFTSALPLLKKHKAPAVFFITVQTNKTIPYLLNDVLDIFASIGPSKLKLNGEEFIKKKRWGHYRYYSVEQKNMAEKFHSLNGEKRQKLLQEIFKQVPVDKFEEHEEYLACMNDEEIKEVASTQGMIVGSHGITHADFSCIKSAELEIELRESKLALEKITGKACRTIAFPYGVYTTETIKKCNALGYTALFGTEKINNTEDRRFVIERMTINPYVSAINLAYYIAKGNYE